MQFCTELLFQHRSSIWLDNKNASPRLTFVGFCRRNWSKFGPRESQLWTSASFSSLRLDSTGTHQMLRNMSHAKVIPIPITAVTCRDIFSSKKTELSTQTWPCATCFANISPLWIWLDLCPGPQWAVARMRHMRHHVARVCVRERERAASHSSLPQ